MVFCIMSAVLAVVVILTTSLGIYVDKSDYLVHSYERHTINYDCVPLHLHRAPQEAADDTVTATSGDVIVNKTMPAPPGENQTHESGKPTEPSYHWYEPDPPCPIGWVKADGYRTPRGRVGGGTCLLFLPRLTGQTSLSMSSV